MTETPAIGAIRVSPQGEYREGLYTIETFDYWNRSEPDWGMPDWTERSYPELWGPVDGHFVDEDEAYRVLAMAIADFTECDEF